jgi:hypothetical protein
MSVADQLGLRGETSELLATPDQGWDHRTTAHPGPHHLLRRAGPEVTAGRFKTG